MLPRGGRRSARRRSPHAGRIIRPTVGLGMCGPDARRSSALRAPGRERGRPVARTVNIANRTVRQDAFIDIAEQLFRTRGYEQTSIQDILDAVGASRGAFYTTSGPRRAAGGGRGPHVLMPTAPRRPSSTTPPSGAEKLRGIFESISSWKLARADLMQAMLEAWSRTTTRSWREVPPPRVGRAHAAAHAESPSRASPRAASGRPPPRASPERWSLLLGFQDEVLELIVAARDEALDFDQVWASVSSFPRCSTRPRASRRERSRPSTRGRCASGSKRTCPYRRSPST